MNLKSDTIRDKTDQFERLAESIRLPTEGEDFKSFYDNISPNQILNETPMNNANISKSIALNTPIPDNQGM